MKDSNQLIMDFVEEAGRQESVMNLKRFPTVDQLRVFLNSGNAWIRVAMPADAPTIFRTYRFSMKPTRRGISSLVIELVSVNRGRIQAATVDEGNRFWPYVKNMGPYYPIKAIEQVWNQVMRGDKAVLDRVYFLDRCGMCGQKVESSSGSFYHEACQRGLI